MPPLLAQAPYRDHPTRLGHLQIYLFDDRTHFLGDGADDHQQIALTRRKPETLRAKSGQIIMAGHRGHELDTATGSRKRQRPQRILAGQSYHAAQTGGKKTFARITIGHICKTDIVLDIGLYRMNVKSYWSSHSR